MIPAGQIAGIAAELHEQIRANTPLWSLLDGDPKQYARDRRESEADLAAEMARGGIALPPCGGPWFECRP